MPHLITVLADGFEEIEAITYIDLLRRAGIDVTVLGLDKTDVCGAHGIRVTADKTLGDFGGDFDAIALPGGTQGTHNLAASGELIKLIHNACDSGKICAAICAAPSVLAKARILDNKKATCYPGCEGMLHAAKIVDEDVVVDGNIITSRAVGTAIPFALTLVEMLAGVDAAEKIRTSILY